MTVLSNDSLPPFTIRKSQRSKRVSLRISPRTGLELVVPKRVSEKQALDFLQTQHDWIQKHSHLLNLQQGRGQPLPTRLNLAAINEEWQIDYQPATPSKNRFKADNATCCLTIYGEPSVDLLRSWLKRKAKRHLIALLQCYSQKYNLPYSHHSIRLQSTRWGSCSRRKDINLNCKLLLLPLNIVHYIIVHELIHTIHFDHSSRFWSAVTELVPNQLALRTELKNIEQSLPNWLY
jgi:predicted metal-dependent hydrolase